MASLATPAGEDVGLEKKSYPRTCNTGVTWGAADAAKKRFGRLPHSMEGLLRMRLSPTAVVDGGVDYLTCSYSPQANMTRLLFFISRVERDELKLGGMHNRWGMSGYQGARVGGLEYGHRHDGAIVRLSGHTARRWWRRFRFLSTNCSRIDLQWTMTYEQQPHRVIEQQFRLMRKLWSTKKRFPEPKLISGPKGGESIKSGDRTSDVFLRLYHRGAKKGLEGLWGDIRYEVEYKGDAARSISSELLRMKRVSERIEAECLGRFQARGCSLTKSYSVPHLYRCNNVPGDVHKRLSWIRNVLRPTVDQLRALGYERQVLDALGFSEPVDQVGPTLN